jgi:hypothetical protein
MTKFETLADCGLRGAALAQKVGEYITEHPDEWNQTEWGVTGSCGTTMCVAGTATWLTGGQWDTDVYSDRYDAFITGPDGEHVGNWAAEVLQAEKWDAGDGCGSGDADRLFMWTPNSWRDTQGQLSQLWDKLEELYGRDNITRPKGY